MELFRTVGRGKNSKRLKIHNYDFYLACKEGDVEKVSEYIAKNTLPPIIYVGLDGNKYLSRSRTNHLTSNNHLALRYASKYGHLELVKILLEHGAGRGIPSVRDRVISLAREQGHFEVEKFLREWDWKRVEGDTDLGKSEMNLFSR